MDTPTPRELMIERDLWVPARDDVRLGTDVYRQTNGGPFPVLLERTPYDKSAPSRSERTAAVPAPRSRAEVAHYFARQGYAIVDHDSCGRYRSEGRFIKYLSETADGYDALVWLMRQPWCNGRIGTFDLSYAAHTQAALGCLDPPGLAAQFLDCGWFFERLSQRHPPWGSLRAEARDVGLQQRRRRRQGPVSQGRTRGGGHHGVVHADAVAQRPIAGVRRTGIRGLPLQAAFARNIRRFLEAPRELCRGLLRALCQCAEVAATAGRR